MSIDTCLGGNLCRQNLLDVAAAVLEEAVQALRRCPGRIILREAADDVRNLSREDI